MGYDKTLRAPRWVAYQLFRIGPTWQKVTAPSRKGIEFAANPATETGVKNHDFNGIGDGIPREPGQYDRGHMAPNTPIATHFQQAGKLKTFLLSNITIQKHDVNTRAWADLETWSFVSMRMSIRMGG